MKILILLVALTTTSDAKAEYVNGHMNRDGTYTNGYYRSAPDNYKYNNYGCINGGRC